MTADETVSVVIVGAGFGGLGMGIKLREAGIKDFIILEKSDDIGGTWRDNTYPRAACDIPSPMYSFSFEQGFDWKRFYAAQPDILRYLRHCADKFQLMPHVRLNSEVANAVFSEESGLWKIATTRGATLSCRALVTATGLLHHPARPNIPGLDSFAGKVFHSSCWDHGHDLSGRRIGIIGTGASAIQFIPHVIDKASQATLFQRTAPHVLPKPDWRLSRFERWLHRRVPPARALVRGAVYCTLEFLGIGLFKFRPALLPLKMLASLHLRRSVKDPQLRRKLTPDYALGCKRVLFDNAFYAAVRQPNVNLVTERIASIEPDGVVTADGAWHKLDTLILGTGFTATSFLAPMKVRGRGGQELSTAWRDGAQAYLGITVSGFPNFFMLSGPNTSVSHNSLVFMLESQIRYVTQAVAHLRARPGTTVELRPEVLRRFNTGLQRALGKSVWASGCNNWYGSQTGKITTNWSGFTFVFRWLTRRFDVENYLCRTAQAGIPAGRPGDAGEALDEALLDS